MQQGLDASCERQPPHTPAPSRPTLSHTHTSCMLAEATNCRLCNQAITALVSGCSWPVGAMPEL